MDRQIGKTENERIEERALEQMKTNSLVGDLVVLYEKAIVQNWGDALLSASSTTVSFLSLSLSHDSFHVCHPCHRTLLDCILLGGNS